MDREDRGQREYRALIGATPEAALAGTPGNFLPAAPMNFGSGADLGPEREHV